MRKGAGILIKLLFIIYLLMVLFFCFYKFSGSSIDLGKHFLGIRLDRYAHFAMFFPYPFIAWLTCNYSKTFKKIKKYSLVVIFFTGLIFASLTEVCQDLLFEYRQGDSLDFAADATGILIATIIVYFVGNWMVKVVELIFKPQKDET